MQGPRPLPQGQPAPGEDGPGQVPGQSGGEAGEAAPTPVSDGQHVYVLFGTGVAACFDLDGNRKWTTVVDVKKQRARLRRLALPDRRQTCHQSQEHLGAVALDGQTGRLSLPCPCGRPKA